MINWTTRNGSLLLDFYVKKPVIIMFRNKKGRKVRKNRAKYYPRHVRFFINYIFSEIRFFSCNWHKVNWISHNLTIKVNVDSTLPNLSMAWDEEPSHWWGQFMQNPRLWLVHLLKLGPKDLHGGCRWHILLISDTLRTSRPK